MITQRRYELTDEEWERIRGYFPEREAGQKGRPRNDDRQILNGILWIARSGAAWRDLPERYGAWSTVYSRFVQWQEEGFIREDLGRVELRGRLPGREYLAAAA